MSQKTAENSDQATRPSLPQADSQASEAAKPDGASKLVPVGESIKYRRRAQQAEGQIQEFEQQLKDFQAQIQGRNEELAAAEAQRDEAQLQLTITENRMTAERMLSEAGVVDLEAASLLLSKRLDFSEAFDNETLARQVEQLLLDKSFLRGAPYGLASSFPPTTASPRHHRASATAQITHAAERAVKTGDRRDIAEYLRLRRQSSLSAIGPTGT